MSGLPLPHANYKLNIDGSYNPSTRTAGVGGILRDAGRKLILAFAAATQACSGLEAEMQALLRGIQMCKAKGVGNVLIEGDSIIIWNFLNSNEGFQWNLMNL